MIKKRTNQIKRNIIMAIGVIVVVIILIYAYLEITSQKPTEHHLLKIKEELQVNISGMGQTIDTMFPDQKIYKDLWIMK